MKLGFFFGHHRAILNTESSSAMAQQMKCVAWSNFKTHVEVFLAITTKIVPKVLRLWQKNKNPSCNLNSISNLT
jgi:hypothetical protein